MAKAALSIMVFTVFLFTGIACQKFQGKPGVKEVEPAVRAYLIADQEKTCRGEVSMEALSIKSVGDFDKTLGGWPVYADFKLKCRSPGLTLTFDGSKNPDAITAIVRRAASGKVECFTPQFMKDALQGLDKALKKMNADFNK